MSTASTNDDLLRYMFEGKSPWLSRTRRGEVVDALHAFFATIPPVAEP